MTQIPPPNGAAQPQKSNVVKYVLIGCLGTFLFAALISCLGVWYVARNVRSIGANVGKTVAVGVINDSNLPDDQKRGIIAHIDRVTDDFKAGKITDEQLGTIMTKIAESPVLVVGLIYLAQEKYVKPSKLSAEEKAAAARSLQRFGRGVYEKTIEQSKVDQVLAPMMETGFDGNKKIKQSITDEELRKVLEMAKAEADRARVVDEDYNVDMTAEIGRVIEETLRPAPVAQPTTTGASTGVTNP